MPCGASQRMVQMRSRISSIDGMRVPLEQLLAAERLAQRDRLSVHRGRHISDFIAHRPHELFAAVAVSRVARKNHIPA